MLRKHARISYYFAQNVNPLTFSLACVFFGVSKAPRKKPFLRPSAAFFSFSPLTLSLWCWFDFSFFSRDNRPHAAFPIYFWYSDDFLCATAKKDGEFFDYDDEEYELDDTVYILDEVGINSFTFLMNPSRKKRLETSKLFFARFRNHPSFRLHPLIVEMKYFKSSSFHSPISPPLFHISKHNLHHHENRFHQIIHRVWKAPTLCLPSQPKSYPSFCVITSLENGSNIVEFTLSLNKRPDFWSKLRQN